MAGRSVAGVAAALLLACAAAACTHGLDEEGACQEGVSNSLLQTRAKARSIATLFTLDEGTYVLEDGTCVLEHVHIHTITYVEKRGEYYAEECLPVCLKLTVKAKEEMVDAEAQVTAVKESLDKAEAALVAGEDKLYEAQAAENAAKKAFDATWKVRYSKRAAPKEEWTKKEEERAAQQKVVADLTKAHYLEEKKYNEWVVARDEKVKVYQETKAAAALCAKVQFPVGSEGAAKDSALPPVLDTVAPDEPVQIGADSAKPPVVAPEAPVETGSAMPALVSVDGHKARQSKHKARPSAKAGKPTR